MLKGFLKFLKGFPNLQVINRAFKSKAIYLQSVILLWRFQARVVNSDFPTCPPPVGGGQWGGDKGPMGGIDA